MLLSQGDQRQQQLGCRRPLATVRQQSTPSNASGEGLRCCGQPAVVMGSHAPLAHNGHCLPLPTQPLSFPAPTFTVARRTLINGGRGYDAVGRGYEGGVFTVESLGSGRKWVATRSVRECQFGDVWQAVELTSTSNTASRYFAIKVSRHLWPFCVCEFFVAFS